MDSRLPEEVRAALTGALWQTSDAGLVASALSAVDLALWDVLGQRAGLPLADLLDGAAHGARLPGRRLRRRGPGGSTHSARRWPISPRSGRRP